MGFHCLAMENLSSTFVSLKKTLRSYKSFASNFLTSLTKGMTMVTVPLWWQYLPNTKKPLITWEESRIWTFVTITAIPRSWLLQLTETLRHWSLYCPRTESACSWRTLRVKMRFIEQVTSDRLRLCRFWYGGRIWSSEWRTRRVIRHCTVPARDWVSEWPVILSGRFRTGRTLWS